MARHRKPKARREAARKKKLYVLEHQRQLAEQERKQYLLTLDPETNRTQLRSLEQTSPSFGLRALFGVMMRRVFSYAPSPIPACDVEYFRFGAGNDSTDNYAEMLLRWHQAKLLEKAG
ncbi:MAG: hypothetical protein V7641_833 [Blastocatellia bacterium]